MQKYSNEKKKNVKPKKSFINTLKLNCLLFGWLQYQEGEGREREDKSSGKRRQLSLGSWASMSTLQMGHFLLVISHWSTHTWWKRCIHGRRLSSEQKNISVNKAFPHQHTYCIKTVMWASLLKCQGFFCTCMFFPKFHWPFQLNLCFLQFQEEIQMGNEVKHQLASALLHQFKSVLGRFNSRYTESLINWGFSAWAYVMRQAVNLQKTVKHNLHSTWRQYKLKSVFSIAGSIAE